MCAITKEEGKNGPYRLCVSGLLPPVALFFQLCQNQWSLICLLFHSVLLKPKAPPAWKFCCYFVSIHILQTIPCHLCVFLQFTDLKSKLFFSLILLQIFILFFSLPFLVNLSLPNIIRPSHTWWNILHMLLVLKNASCPLTGCAFWEKELKFFKSLPVSRLKA